MDIVPLDALQAPVVVQAVAYWRRLCAGRRMPRRDEINLREITSLLKHIVVARVLDGGDDFLLKIAGDEVVRSYRAPILNRRMREIAADLPKTAERWLPLYRRVTDTGEPLAIVVTLGLEVPEVNFTHAETVCLPFGPEEGPVDYLATIGSHISRPGLLRL